PQAARDQRIWATRSWFSRHRPPRVLAAHSPNLSAPIHSINQMTIRVGAPRQFATATAQSKMELAGRVSAQCCRTATPSEIRNDRAQGAGKNRRLALRVGPTPWDHGENRRSWCHWFAVLRRNDVFGRRDFETDAMADLKVSVPFRRHKLHGAVRQ